MRRLTSLLGVLFLMSALAGCPVPEDSGVGEGEGEGEGNTGEGEGEDLGCVPDADTGFPAPLTTVTTAIGSDATLDIGAWNIRNFPRTSGTVRTVADIMTSLNLDLMAVEEMEDEAAFRELVKRLPNHEGVLSTHTYSTGDYQKLGFIYRCGTISPVGPPQLPFASDGFNFPRPPLQQRFRYTNGATSFEFIAIAVHFKASEGNNDAESSARRSSAFQQLANYTDSLVRAQGPDEVVIMGDFNERLDEPAGEVNWTPFLDDSRYVVRSLPLSQRGEASFLSSTNAMLDHIVTTRAFDDEVGAGTAAIPRLEQEILNYRDAVSDHRPITLVMRGGQ